MPGRTPKDVRDKVLEVKTNNPGWGAIRVHAEVTKRAGGIEIVSKRTVGSILTEFPNLSREDIRALRYVRWPDTFERGELPWEASAAVLRLLRIFQAAPPESPGMPTVGIAEWFWRLTLADAPIPDEQLFLLAGWLHVTAIDPVLGATVRRRVAECLIGARDPREPMFGPGEIERLSQ